MTRLSEMRLESIPALKIGRLAVARSFQDRGLGRTPIVYAAGLALEMGATAGVRLLMLEANPESVDFYEKCGFQFTFVTRRQRARNKKTMFFDLQSIDELP